MWRGSSSISVNDNRKQQAYLHTSVHEHLHTVYVFFSRTMWGGFSQGPGLCRRVRLGCVKPVVVSTYVSFLSLPLSNLEGYFSGCWIYRRHLVYRKKTGVLKMRNVRFSLFTIGKNTKNKGYWPNVIDRTYYGTGGGSLLGAPAIHWLTDEQKERLYLICLFLSVKVPCVNCLIEDFTLQSNLNFSELK